MVPYKNNAVNEVDHTIMVRKVLEDPSRWLENSVRDSVNHSFVALIFQNSFGEVKRSWALGL